MGVALSPLSLPLPHPFYVENTLICDSLSYIFDSSRQLDVALIPFSFLHENDFNCWDASYSIYIYILGFGVGKGRREN